MKETNDIEVIDELTHTEKATEVNEEVGTVEVDGAGIEEIVVEEIEEVEVKPLLKLEQWEKEICAEENMDLIHFVANKFRNTRLPYDDLYSVCMMGYTKALNAFDKNRGVKLSTFAVNCMQNEVKFYLRKEKKHTTNTVSSGTVLSRDKNGNDFQLEDILSEKEKENILSVEETYELSEDKGIVVEAIASLTVQEQYIMNSRYGLNGFKVKTQKLIAEEIHMSQANVSKIQKNCIDKIKRFVESQYEDERIQF